MPSIKDKSTVDAIARDFCKHRCKSRALQAGGYSELYSKRLGLRLFTNVHVVQAIKRIDDATKADFDYNLHESKKRKEALLAVCASLVYNKDGTVCAAPDKEAIRIMHTVLKQLDNVCGLEDTKDTPIQVNIDHSTALTEEQRLRKRLDLIDRMHAQPSGIERN